MSVSAVSSFIAYLLFCNSGDHRYSGIVSTIFELGRATSGYAERMLSVAVSALPTVPVRHADYIATSGGYRYGKLPLPRSLRNDNLDPLAEEFRPCGEQVGAWIETMD